MSGLIWEPAVSGGLLSAENLNLQAILSHYVSLVSGSRVTRGGDTVPRYVESLLARHTPFFVYDHPGLSQIVDTACTDGQVVLVHAGFLKQMIRDERESGGENVVPVLLHELEHIILRHCDRGIVLSGGDPALQRELNLAADLYINGNLVRSYGDTGQIRFGGLFMNTAQGVDEETMSWTKGKTLMEIWYELRRRNMCRGRGPGADQGDGAPGRFSPGGKSGSPGGDGGRRPDLVVSPEELREILEEIGAKSAADRLKLPKRGVPESSRRYRESGRNVVMDSLEKTTRAYRDSEEGGDYPGKGFLDEVAEMVSLSREPVMTLAEVTRDVVAAGSGDAMRYRPDIEDPACAFGDPSLLVLGAHIPRSETPVTLVFLDTSGSMSNEQLSESLTEIVNLAVSSEGEREFLLGFADTVVRGELIRLNEETGRRLLDEGRVNVRGRGGTAIREVLIQGWEQAKTEAGADQIDSVLYFTDLCDELPSRKDLPDDLLRCCSGITYVTLEGLGAMEMRDHVGDYAVIREIRPGEEIRIGEVPEAGPVSGSAA